MRGSKVSGAAITRSGVYHICAMYRMAAPRMPGENHGKMARFWKPRFSAIWITDASPSACSASLAPGRA